MANSSNIRSGNMRVPHMVEEVNKRIAVLELGYNPETMPKRVKIKLEQGRNFLEMISKPPYCTCKTVSSLTHMISDRRSDLQARSMALDYNMPGHQFSLFEQPQEVTPEQQEEIAREQMWLNHEINWLHKCLGICKNRDYFEYARQSAD